MVSTNCSSIRRIRSNIKTTAIQGGHQTFAAVLFGYPASFKPFKHIRCLRLILVRHDAHDLVHLNLRIGQTNLVVLNITICCK